MADADADAQRAYTETTPSMRAMIEKRGLEKDGLVQHYFALRDAILGGASGIGETDC